MSTTKMQLIGSRASEKSSAALYVLVTSTGKLRERFTKAWVRNFCDIKVDELPVEFRERYREMYENVSTHGIEREGEGLIHASIRHMKPDDVEYWSRQLVAFAIDVEIAMSKQ